MKEIVLRIEIKKDNPKNGSYFRSYLDLPATEHEIHDALQKARVNSRDDAHYDVTITFTSYLYTLKQLKLECPTVEELNFLSKRLFEMDGVTRKVYESILRSTVNESEIVSMKHLINCTYGLNEVMVVSNISNDEPLGKFLIDNGMCENINAIPQEVMHLIDRAKIGEMYRKAFGVVYNTGMCVFVGDYKIPEVYDGEHLPEEKLSTEYIFRLKIGISPENTKWIDLPIDQSKADAIAHMCAGVYAEDCEYYGFESSIPQITSEMFGSMQNFNKLNKLAAKIAGMSPTEQIKLKAVLYAEKPVGINGVTDIAKHLHMYELDTSVADDGAFFKSYLAHHLDTRFDTKWLETLSVSAEGAVLLRRLGAMVTDYGAISAYGHSLYMIVPCTAQEADFENAEEMTLGGM